MARPVFALLAVLMLTIGACGDDDDDDEDAGDDATTTSAAAPADDDEAAGGDAVTIAGFAFDPASIEVSAGTTVTWSNDDGAQHTVTAGEPGSPVDTFGESVDAGSTAEITFDEAGTFPYFCTIHPSMTAEVVVS
jgi:plastocyanin